MALQQQNIIPFPNPDRASRRAKARKIKFTQTKVEALRHRGGAPEYIYDLGKPGLAVRLTSGGARTFVFVGRLHGKAQRITLGRLESLPLAKARGAVDKIRGDIALGLDVIAQRKALRDSNSRRKTLGEAFEEFIAGERHKKKTRCDYQNLWKLYVAERLARRPLHDITAEEVRKVHGQVTAAVAGRVRQRAKEEGANGWNGHRTATKVVALLRTVLAYAGRRADNPAAGVIWFKQAPRRRRLSDQEAAQFREALETFEEPWRDFFTLLLLTGVRRQSLLAMRWTDVDLQRKRWVVPATWSKHGDEMIIPLTTEATKLLSEMKKHRGTSSWVFPSTKSKSGHIEEPKSAWGRLLKAAGIAELRLHDLRRTFGSRLAETGANGAVIAAAMGHKSLQSARSYLHLQIDAVREAAERAAITMKE
jgi:integrase